MISHYSPHDGNMKTGLAFKGQGQGKVMGHHDGAARVV